MGDPRQLQPGAHFSYPFPPVLPRHCQPCHITNEAGRNPHIGVSGRASKGSQASWPPCLCTIHSPGAGQLHNEVANTPPIRQRQVCWKGFITVYSQQCGRSHIHGSPCFFDEELGEPAWSLGGPRGAGGTGEEGG